MQIGCQLSLQLCIHSKPNNFFFVNPKITKQQCSHHFVEGSPMMPKVEERSHGLGGLGLSHIQTNKHFYIYIYIQNIMTNNK